ncbi:MAG: carboxymuconolactone decarboxylase family protein [Chloroflexi bacterium]|jgi:alkylhydroperoxidase/carboxymuconolactone decarboxylase family protein YurZ|nr:carboxymuconolactone decarboxylase family protein [Chloroflexota bacterium]
MKPSALLEQLRAERGYLLSYHEVYGRLEPEFLQEYADLYRAFTLRPRFLTPRQRELVWTGLLTAIHEHVGSLHLERAVAAGVTAEELAAAVTLAGVADAWPSLAFGAQRWQQFIHAEVAQLYGALLEGGRGPIEPGTATLIVLVVQGARRREEPFVHHLRQLLDAGVPEIQIAEALSYLLLPVGANTLLWATDLWLQALRDGRLPESPTFGRADFRTRVE